MSQLVALVNRIAFCETCPLPEQVTTLLKRYGFALVFQMNACISHSTSVPDLPAQYHYCDAHGTEVIYLAGRDANVDGEQLPAHASRFWLSPGKDEQKYQHIASALATTFRFGWRRDPQKG